MYKGWIYDIQGSSNSNYFNVVIKPDPFLAVDIAQKVAKLEHQDIVNQHWSGNNGLFSATDFINGKADYLGNKGLNHISKEWIYRLETIKIEKTFNKPSGLFTQYSQRLKDVEVDVKRYIDSELHDFCTWLQNNCNRI